MSEPVLESTRRRLTAKQADTVDRLGKAAVELLCRDGFAGLTVRRVAAEATPDRTDNNENEPVVYAWVRIDGRDIPEGYRITPEMLVSGTEVRTRVRCGNRAMGYSLFYGIWEFFYEKVVFWF